MEWAVSGGQQNFFLGLTVVIRHQLNGQKGNRGRGETSIWEMVASMLKFIPALFTLKKKKKFSQIWFLTSQWNKVKTNFSNLIFFLTSQWSYCRSYNSGILQIWHSDTAHMRYLQTPNLVNYLDSYLKFLTYSEAMLPFFFLVVSLLQFWIQTVPVDSLVVLR